MNGDLFEIHGVLPLKAGRHSALGVTRIYPVFSPRAQFNTRSPLTMIGLPEANEYKTSGHTVHNIVKLAHHGYAL